MAILITPTNRQDYATYLDQYFQLRHKVFNEWLGWGLENRQGREIDQFDRPDTIYFLTFDDRGHVDSGARLIPTMDAYMISEVFPQLMEGNPIPREPGIWEMSKFVIDWKAHDGDRQMIRKVSGDVACAITEFCVLNDIYELVSVLVEHWEPRVSRAFGDPVWKSSPMALGNTSSIAVRYAVSYPHLRATRQRFDLPSPSIRQLAEVVHA